MYIYIYIFSIIYIYMKSLHTSDRFRIIWYHMWCLLQPLEFSGVNSLAVTTLWYWGSEQIVARDFHVFSDPKWGAGCSEPQNPQNHRVDWVNFLGVGSFVRYSPPQKIQPFQCCVFKITGYTLEDERLEPTAITHKKKGKWSDHNLHEEMFHVTPMKFNMEPENDGDQKESPFPGTSFQVPC